MSLPQKPVRRGSRLGTAIAISVVAHVLLLPFVAQDAIFKGPQHKQGVAIISKAQFQDILNRQAQARAQSSNFNSSGQPATPNRLKPPEEKKAEEEKKAAELLKMKGQLVSLPKPEDGRAPLKDTKYLAEFDSRVEKETRAKDASAFNKNALNTTVKEGRKDSAGEGAPALSEKPGEAGEGGGKTELRKKQAMELPSKDRTAALHAKEAANGTLRNRESSDEVKGKGRKLAMAQPGRDAQSSNVGEGPSGAKPGLPGELAPLKLKLDQPIGAAGPIEGGPMADELRDVEEGNGTFLNARGFKFASYLNRIKETVGRVWAQKVQDAQMQRDPTGRIYGLRDRRTIVEYVIDKDGEVKDVHVEASSGVQYLDEVAVDAFRQVERFPNPPAGLIQADGLVKMNFSFLLIGDSGGIHMQMGPAYVPGSAAARGF
jgi:TonB family protein